MTRCLENGTLEEKQRREKKKTYLPQILIDLENHLKFTSSVLGGFRVGGEGGHDGEKTVFLDVD